MSYTLIKGQIQDEGTFEQMSASDNLYAKLLTTEPEATDDDKKKFEDSTKLKRKLSIRVSKKEYVYEVISVLIFFCLSPY